VDEIVVMRNDHEEITALKVFLDEKFITYYVWRSLKFLMASL